VVEKFLIGLSAVAEKKRDCPGGGTVKGLFFFEKREGKIFSRQEEINVCQKKRSCFVGGRVCEHLLNGVKTSANLDSQKGGGGGGKEIREKARYPLKLFRKTFQAEKRKYLGIKK